MATTPRQGDFVWFELLTTDAEASKRFYTELFGWSTFGDEPGAKFPYVHIRANGAEVGGMLPMTGPEWRGVPPHWLTYVWVDDVDATAQKVAELGGKIIAPPRDVPNVGRFAVIQDTLGAVLALYHGAGGQL
jgi:hypothetical protein